MTKRDAMSNEPKKCPKCGGKMIPTRDGTGHYCYLKCGYAENRDKPCPKCGAEMESVDCTPIDTYPFASPIHEGDWVVCTNPECGHEEKVK
jgi:uncharacterized protein with PIN domain